jgi:hypothetical protein
MIGERTNAAVQVLAGDDRRGPGSVDIAGPDPRRRLLDLCVDYAAAFRADMTRWPADSAASTFDHADSTETPVLKPVWAPGRSVRGQLGQLRTATGPESVPGTMELSPSTAVVALTIDEARPAPQKEGRIAERLIAHHRPGGRGVLDPDRHPDLHHLHRPEESRKDGIEPSRPSGLSKAL